MTSKEYLGKIRDIDAKIQIIQDQISELKAMIEYQGINYDKIGFMAKNSYQEDKRIQMIYRLMELHEDLINQYSLLASYKEEAKNIITSLDNPIQTEILYRKYFMYQKISTISKEMNYSRKQIDRIHHTALENVEKLINL